MSRSNLVRRALALALVAASVASGWILRGLSDGPHPPAGGADPLSPADPRPGTPAGAWFAGPEEYLAASDLGRSGWVVRQAPDLPGPYLSEPSANWVLSEGQWYEARAQGPEGPREYYFRPPAGEDWIVCPVNTAFGWRAYMVLRRPVEARPGEV